MNAKIQSVVAAGLLLAASATTFAEETRYYVEAGYGGLTYKEPGYTLKPAAARLIFGSKVHDNVALEGMGAIGISDGSASGVKLSFDNGVGAYTKVMFPVSESAEIFGRIGYFRGSLTASAGSVSIGTSGSDLSYGVGAAIKVADNVSVVTDYMSYYNKNGISINGWSLGARFGF